MVELVILKKLQKESFDDLLSSLGIYNYFVNDPEVARKVSIESFLICLIQYK